VEVLVDPYYENMYPEKWGAKVDIELTDGNVFTDSTDYPKGDPEKPASKNELIEKFLEMASSELENAELHVEQILNLEQINVKDWLSEETRDAACNPIQ
jgi:2-methylcitrate dehydratase PrpD